jgi:hypothetical protein
MTKTTPSSIQVRTCRRSTRTASLPLGCLRLADPRQSSHGLCWIFLPSADGLPHWVVWDQSDPDQGRDAAQLFVRAIEAGLEVLDPPFQCEQARGVVSFGTAD